MLLEPGQARPLEVAAVVEEEVEVLEEVKDWEAEVEAGFEEGLEDEPDALLVPDATLVLDEITEDAAELLVRDEEPELDAVATLELGLVLELTALELVLTAEELLKPHAFVEGLYCQAIQELPSAKVLESQADAQALALVVVVVA